MVLKKPTEEYIQEVGNGQLWLMMVLRQLQKECKIVIWFSNKMMIYDLGKEVSKCGGSEGRMECPKWKIGTVVEAGSINNSFNCEEEEVSTSLVVKFTITASLFWEQVNLTTNGVKRKWCWTATTSCCPSWHCLCILAMQVRCLIVRQRRLTHTIPNNNNHKRGSQHRKADHINF